MLSILSGSLIHTQLNQQSIYRIKINNSLINVSYIQLSTILILSISKEGIINSLNFCISSYFIFILSLFGSIFTTLYSVKVWYYCFVWGVNIIGAIIPSSPPPPLVMPILNSLLIDECLEHCFSLSSFTLFYSSSFPFLFAYSSGVTGLGILLFILIILLLYFSMIQGHILLLYFLSFLVGLRHPIQPASFLLLYTVQIIYVLDSCIYYMV